MQFPFTLIYEMEFKPCYYFAIHTISARLTSILPVHFIGQWIKETQFL